MYIVSLVFMVLLIPGVMGQEAPSDLLVLTEEYAPFNYHDNGNLKGLSVDLLESAFHHMDLNISRDSFQLVSWAEGYETALSRNNTVLFTTGRIPQREELFLWAGPIISDAKVLYGITKNDSSSFGDIRSYRIVAVQNDTGSEMAIKGGANPEQITTVVSAKDAIGMIENGTADAWSYGMLSGRDMINKYASEPEKFSTILEFGTIDEYYAFNKESDPSFVDALNTTLSELKSNKTESGRSEYEQIIARYKLGN